MISKVCIKSYRRIFREDIMESDDVTMAFSRVAVTGTL